MPQYSDGSAVAGRERIRRRTTSSCDACKARKTKCIDPVPGPCRYCAGISAACTITPKPKRRPFYSVSEEEYRYGIEILQRLFPNETLNLRTLRNLAMKVAEEHENPGRDGTPPSRGMPNQATAETEPEDDAPLQDNAESESFSSAPSVSAGPLVEAAPTISQQEWDEPRVPILAQKEGYLTTDWSGTTRYIGPHCDALFISAVNSCAEGEPLLPFFRQPTHALRFTVAPPASLESRSSVTRPCPVNFPPRQDWARHLDRYFKDVNSTYWLISAESFYSRLDSTYATRSTEDSEAPWTCFLCAVLALTSQTKDVNGDSTRQCGLSSGSPQSVEDNSTTAEYISSAKLLLKDVMDEANLDSIRAFCAMSIFMYNEGFPIPSYLYIGTAVKIAYTLGLHQPKAYASMTASNRETALRMAWTMYQVDCEVSRPTGRPTSIDQANWHPIMPSETLTTTGIFDPWELFESTISFHMEDLRLFSRFSGLANHANQEAVYGEINDCVVSLQMWYDRIPSHLQWNIPVPTSHRRPICLLHLRYWSTILSCTRVVFLRDIQLVGMTQGHRPPQYSALGLLCMDACESSLQILEQMKLSGVLSSLITADTKYIVDIAMIFFLLSICWPQQRPQQHLDRCMEILQSMESIGWCKFATEGLEKITSRYKARLLSDDTTSLMGASMSAGAQSASGTTFDPQLFADIGLDLLWTEKESLWNYDFGLAPWDLCPESGNSSTWQKE